MFKSWSQDAKEVLVWTTFVFVIFLSIVFLATITSQTSDVGALATIWVVTGSIWFLDCVGVIAYYATRRY